MENYKQQIGSKRRSFLMLCTVILMVILIVGGFYFIPSANYVFSDPIKADYNTIYTYSASPEKVEYVVTIVPDYDFYFQTVYMVDEVITEYFIGLVNDEGYFVLAELSADDFESETLSEYKGHFVPLDEEIRASIIDDLMQENFTYDEAVELTPFYLFKVKDQRTPFLVLFIGLVIIAILFIILLSKWLTFNLDRYLEKQLSKYGDADQMINALETTPINFSIQILQLHQPI